MQGKGLWIGLGVVLAALLVGGYLMFVRTPKVTAPGGASPQPATIPGAQEGGAETGQGQEVREIAVEGDEYSFSPAGISVSKGEKIKLTFTNSGNLPHNFRVDELGIATKTISGGATDTIEFTAEKSGTFTSYCGVGSHRSLGMEGSLEVQ